MDEQKQRWIEKLRQLPHQLEALVTPLSKEQLTTAYLAGEWTVAQNVHHLADSHMNSYIRCKLIVTEENPLLKPYDQDAWAALPDAQSGDLSTSLALLKSLHARWVDFWAQLPPDAWERTATHPEQGTVSLIVQLEIYAAHGEGHLAQIQRTLAAQPR
ncbi:MAG: putative metal-dependent hydrolase [Ardenticatenales bacterium]|nr:putative metal-dependent hydrolase [Ardenticatenales bacterium]